jgi:hypothetical protein
MFGLFKDKGGSALATTVAAETGASLVAETRFPAELPTAAAPAWGRCSLLAVEGQPPALQRAEQALPGQTQQAWRIDNLPGQTPLLLLNRREGAVRLEVWELADASALKTQRQRASPLDPEQGSWSSYRAQDVRCLPQQQLLVPLYYTRPAARHGLYVYDLRAQVFRRLADRIEANPLAGLPPRFVDVLPAGPEAALVLFHTDPVRLAAEVYINRYDHLVLFSPRHPQGLALLKLAVDKGNITRWVMNGAVLHLETIDPRERGRPVTYRWSLNLARVL